MTIDALSQLSSAGLLSDEDVFPAMRRWQAAGQRVALVTLVGVEGGAPRQPGAHMAVAEDGRYAGYLSGGCLEDSVALEAKAAIAARQNRLVRYGKGSRYVDIRLPCGSGLDLYFDQTISAVQLAEMAEYRAKRRPFMLATDMDDQRSTVILVESANGISAPSHRVGNVFERVFTPPLQVLLLGSGPALVAIATLAEALGIALKIVTPDSATRGALGLAGRRALIDDADLPETLAGLDCVTAAILIFHEHEREIDHLAALLETQCFYIGALGNHAVHRERRQILAARGVSEASLDRIRAPIGSIPAAKSKATLAVGVLAEMMAQAKARNLVP
ncbi:XdhC family protein [Hyphomicrobium nitrativorans]|nr:XdhC family protein [Hyphomicrobium nitrativorans]